MTMSIWIARGELFTYDWGDSILLFMFYNTGSLIQGDNSTARVFSHFASSVV